MDAPAKIALPTLVNIYPRQRLFGLLERGQLFSATWVCGPPGAGKTTLVASWFATRHAAPIWMRLDVGDSDIATFFHYLGHAARATKSGRKRPLPQFSPEYRLDLQTFSRRYFRDLYSRLSDPFVIVFDNYQEITPDSPVHEVMQYALEEVPAQGRMIFVSRSEPPARFARLQVNHQIHFVEPADLCLDSEEAKGIVSQRAVDFLDDQQLATFLEKTQGWAAGLVLLCETAQHPEQYQSRVIDTSPQKIFDYFAGEVLGRADADARDVLFTAALLPSVPRAIAGKLTGHRQAEAVLETLCSRNYFTTRDNRENYQFHPLFLAFLAAQASQTFSSAVMTKKLRQAANIFESSGQVEAAVTLWLEAGSWLEAAGSLLACAPAMLSQGRHATLMHWIARMPPEIMEDAPWLLYWRGMATLPFDPAASHRHLSRAHALFQQREDRIGLLKSWAGAAMSICTDGAGDYQRLDAWIVELDRVVPDLAGFPSSQVEFDVAYCAFTAMFFRAPRHPMIEMWRERAITLARVNANINQHVSTLIIAIHYDLMRGDTARAALSVDAMNALCTDDAQLQPMARIRRRAAFAYYHWRIGEADTALRHMFSGLEAASISGVHLWDYQLYAHGIGAAQFKGDAALAERLLGEMGQDPLVSGGFAGALYHIVASWFKGCHGDLAAAQAHAMAAVRIAEENGVARGVAYRGYATVLCKQHKFVAAREALAKALDIARHDANPLLEFMDLILEASLDFAEGRDGRAFATLCKGMALGRDHQIVVSTAWDNDTMAPLCARALQAGIEPGYVRHIIRLHRMRPPSLVDEHWPWRLKIYALGRFAVSKDDLPLKFAGKAPKKLISLLKAIIALGGREVPDHVLIDALWPEQEADAAHEAFEVALRRLRKLLGEDTIIVREGRVTLDECYVWLDTRAFEHLLAEAQAATGMAVVAQALKLYHGTFLAGDPDVFWSLSARERLRGKFIRYSAMLGKAHSASGAWDQALAVYLSGMEADNLSEELYQGAMRCYRHLGRHAEGVAVYRRLRQTLSIMLGIQPSAASEQLYQALMAG